MLDQCAGHRWPLRGSEASHLQLASLEAHPAWPDPSGRPLSPRRYRELPVPWLCRECPSGHLLFHRSSHGARTDALSSGRARSGGPSRPEIHGCTGGWDASAPRSWALARSYLARGMRRCGGARCRRLPAGTAPRSGRARHGRRRRADRRRGGTFRGALGGARGRWRARRRSTLAGRAPAARGPEQGLGRLHCLVHGGDVVLELAEIPRLQIAQCLLVVGARCIQVALDLARDVATERSRATAARARGPLRRPAERVGQSTAERRSHVRLLTVDNDHVLELRLRIACLLYVERPYVEVRLPERHQQDIAKEHIGAVLVQEADLLGNRRVRLDLRICQNGPDDPSPTRWRLVDVQLRVRAASIQPVGADDEGRQVLDRIACVLEERDVLVGDGEALGTLPG